MPPNPAHSAIVLDRLGSSLRLDTIDAVMSSARAVRPAGQAPRRCDGNAGAYRATQEVAASRPPRGRLSAPAFRRFFTRAILWLSTALLFRSLALGLEPLKAAGGSKPLPALHRKRSTRASWSSSLRRLYLPGAGRRPREGRMRIHVPSQAGGAVIMTRAREPGINAFMVTRVNCLQAAGAGAQEPSRLS